MIQHRAARFVSNQPWSKHYRDSISEMLCKLNWLALQAKRKPARLIFLFNKEISIPDQYLPSSFPCDCHRISPPPKLQQLYIGTDIYRSLFKQFLIGIIKAGPHSIEILFNETFEPIIHNYI